ncbi:hypothetical protein MASR2M29_24200 [Spirochaetota bacterium]
MIIVAAILAVIAVVLLFTARSHGKKALDIGSVETSTAKDLISLAEDVAKEIGAGSFSQQVELKGVAESGQSLKSEMTAEPCVWYRSVVTREYEENYTERDSDGKTTTRTRRGSEIVSSNERSIAFALRDASGSITVDPDGASIDSVKVLSRFENGELGTGFSIGSFRFSVGVPGRGRRTLGYKMEEFILPLGKDLYVLGEARDESGKLKVGKPSKKGARFIISTKSEEELLKAAKGGQKGLNIAAIALGIGAIAMAVFSFFK